MKRLISTLALALSTSIIAVAAQAAEVKNIVIVHGALADGSGWRKATDILERRGFNVTIVQEPITSLADDVAATNRVLDLQDGSSLLVGHSYSGMVISEAGNRPDVAGLVYVAAFQPEKSESLLDLAGSKPPAGNSIKQTKDAKFLHLDPAAFLAKSQVFAAKDASSAKVGDPAWKTKRAGQLSQRRIARSTRSWSAIWPKAKYHDKIYQHDRILFWWMK